MTVLSVSPAAPSEAIDALDAVRRRMTERFGLVPSFFMMAREDPTLVGAMYGLAEFAYFDSPLPSLFKERLFTYVSRFCAVPYCMARHCGFLVGRGHVAGNATAAGTSVEAVVEMLTRPFPDSAGRAALLEELSHAPPLAGAWPTAGSPEEDRIFFAAAVIFVTPLESQELLRELKRVLGGPQLNYLLLFLGFIRFAHFWTETHPDLSFEDDLTQLIDEHRALASWIAGYGAVVDAELQRRVDAELVELNALRSRTAELEEVTVTLREETDIRVGVANRARVGFMAMVSHELRTPLNAILGYVDLLQSGIGGPLSDRAAEYIDRIRLTARHQQSLIEEILSFSRLAAGRELVTLAPLELRDLCEEVTAVVAPLAQRKGLAFLIACERAHPTVWTDPGKIRQILLNLVGNAVKFTSTGQISVSISTAQGQLEITVADTGPGIPPTDRERMFEPFVQADTSTSRAHGGTGLGLTITRHLVELMGGRISVESAEGSGSVFTVTLPLATRDPTLLSA